MKKLDYEELKLGDVVMCPEICENMDFGWADEMNDMVGHNHTVKSKTFGGGVKVYENYPDSNNYFTFYYKNLILIAKKGIFKDFQNFCVDNIKYKQRQTVSLDILSSLTLIPDFTAFKTLLEKDNNIATNNIILNISLYKKIKIICPRVIGVLISNNILERRE